MIMVDNHDSDSRHTEVCADAGRSDAVATETDCSSVAHVMQVQLQVSCKCTQHNE